MDRVIDAYAGEGLVAIDPQVSRILNKYDMTFGKASYINIIAIKHKARSTVELWILIHRLLALFGIEVKPDPDAENKMLNYLLKLQNEIAKRFPSLLELYNDLLVELYTNVKYLRNQDGFERINQNTKREQVIHVGGESEKAEQTRESVIKEKLKGFL